MDGPNAVDLSSAKPSPEGEGWVRGNKNKEKTNINPLIPAFSLREKGFVFLSQ
jgi:hypothetical protein